MADYARLRTPFLNMSFTPDVPSNALGANEYNNGLNVEADVRGIKKISGEEAILSQVPGSPVFIDGGFRGAIWTYIVATNAGKWYAVTASGITNITPGVGANPNVALSGYSDNVNITSSWVGNVFFINDALRAPMYFLPTATEIYLYGAAPDNYIWNYESNVSAVRAEFVRNFCSPNVGNILIAGNLTKDFISSGTTVNYPTTVRWSQSFANTGVPATWQPTLTNIANEQEIPLRGPIVDGFFLGANFYVCSYWDTVIFAPLSYQNSTAPIFGVRLFNQGRGLLNNNCWSNTDANVYGVDSRDIWIFDGSNFNPLGNQKVRDYFFANLSTTYSDRVFMVNNTQKNQIELYYPDLTSTGWCNKMLSWRYDLQIWNAPKDIANACNGCEAPKYVSGAFKYASRTVAYMTGGASSQQIIQTGVGNSFINSGAINARFQRDNIVLQTEKGPVPYSSKIYTHRLLPEVSGSGTMNITVGGANSTAQAPTYGQTGVVSIVTDTPWVTTQQNNVRTISIKLESNDATDTWNVTALNWQATVVEDAF
jgi:hypothetical protein